jgi:hypothetical protein
MQFGLLRSKSPALEIFAHAAHRDANPTLAFDQKQDGGARPQSEIKLELLGAFVRDLALNLLFLLGREPAATACRATTPARLDATHAILIEAIDNHAHRGITQPKLTGNPTTVHSAFVGANDLTAMFMLRIWR